MGLTLDNLVDALDPLLRLPLAPFAIAALAALLRADAADALYILRTQPGREAAREFVSVVRRGIRESKLLKLVLAIVAARTLNRVGHRLFVDRQAARRIDWRHHVVVISGGARGIGGGVAERLADRGAKVVTIDMAERTAHSRETRHFKADVSDEAQLLDIREQIHKELGMVTMVVSCAGIARPCAVLDPPSVISLKYHTDMVNVNLNGTLNFVRVFSQDMLPAAKEGEPRVEGGRPANKWGGHILMIASGAAFTALPYNAMYAASKAGVVAMWTSLNWELDVVHKARGVRNSVICPLKVHTSMTANERMSDQADQFMTPSLTVDQVASRMVQILESDRSQQVHLPASANGIALVSPALPDWLRRAVFKGLGVHKTFFAFAQNNRRMIADP